MAKKKKSAEETKKIIIKTAQILFTRHGFNGVTIRMIAEEAKINHALLIRYFGSKETLWEQIILDAVNSFTQIPKPDPDWKVDEILDSIRQVMLKFLTNEDLKVALQIIVRGEMDGLSPESIVVENHDRLTNKMATFIKDFRVGTNSTDPKIAAVIIMSAMASLITISPWLLSAVELTIDDYNQRIEEFIDCLVDIIKHFLV